MRKLSAVGSALLVAGLISAGAAGAENLVLLSTQLRPIEEAQKMRNVILKDFRGKVDYVTEQPAQLPVRIKAEQQGGTHTIDVRRCIARRAAAARVARRTRAAR